jgi:hypothetical protein
MQETVKIMPTLTIGLAVREEHHATIERNRQDVVDGVVYPINKASAMYMNHCIIQVTNKEDIYNSKN